jgi:transitional endoplasmic reticulum ATPase
MARSNGSTPPPGFDMEALAHSLLESEKLDAYGDPVHGESEQEKNSKRILAALDALGGQTVGDDSLVFTGQQFILPANMEGNVKGAVRYLNDWDEQQNTEFGFSRTYHNRPFDGAAAFERAMKRVFGTSGVGRATFSMFGSNPPEYRTIASGPDSTMQVPWGSVEFSPLEATFGLGYTVDSDFGIVFELSVEAPRRHRRRVEGFFAVVEDELARNSIYKGAAITSDTLEPKFLDTSKVDESKIIYKQEVKTQLDVNLWAPLRYTAALRKAGVPLKRAVLVEGPNGTGKTLAGLRTAQIAQENGWTFILVQAGEDPLEALKTARVYAPAVVWVEDLDVIASADASSTSRKKISKVLDVLDGLQGKGSEVMAGFTTNFVEKLDKGVLRPGRLDAVIHIAELDAEGYEQLVRALTPAHLLDDSVDMALVAQAYEGFLPAFAAEATLRAMRYSIARNKGEASTISTADLVDAAHGMKNHLDLMERAQHTGTDVVTLDMKVTETVQAAMANVEGKLRARGGERITFASNEAGDGGEA